MIVDEIPRFDAVPDSAARLEQIVNDAGMAVLAAKGCGIHDRLSQ